jgi:hypothetical protein
MAVGPLLADTIIEYPEDICLDMIATGGGSWCGARELHSS